MYVVLVVLLIRNGVGSYFVRNQSVKTPFPLLQRPLSYTKPNPRSASVSLSSFTGGFKSGIVRFTAARSLMRMGAIYGSTPKLGSQHLCLLVRPRTAKSHEGLVHLDVSTSCALGRS